MNSQRRELQMEQQEKTSGARLGLANSAQVGGLLGMGVEYAFLPNWSAKLEYNYIDFGTRSFNAALNASFAGTPLAPLAGGDGTDFGHRGTSTSSGRGELSVGLAAVFSALCHYRTGPKHSHQQDHAGDDESPHETEQR